MDPARLPHLETLILADNSLGIEHARRIECLTAVPPRLRTLDLSGTGFNDEAAACLARAPALAELKELLIANCDISAIGIQSLLDSKYLQYTLLVVSTKDFAAASRHRIEERLREHNDRCFAPSRPSNDR
jgi:hypothetical protein